MPKNAFLTPFKLARRLLWRYFDAFSLKKAVFSFPKPAKQGQKCAFALPAEHHCFQSNPSISGLEQQSTHFYIALSYEKSRWSSRATVPPYHNTPHSVTGFLALSSAKRTYLCVCVRACVRMSHFFLHYLEFREVLNVSSRRSSLNS